MTLKALIFDVDGTLAETEKNGHRLAFNFAFDQYNLPWQWDEDLYGQLLEIGGGKERLRHYLQQYKPQYQPPENLDDFIVNLHQTKSHFYRQLLENNSIPLRPGVERLLQEAYNNGIKLAIASTASLDNVHAFLDNSMDGEMAKLFTVIAAGDMVKEKKPAPDIYLLALKELNLSAKECLAIEDTNQGLVAAKKAGLCTIITVNEYTKNQDFSRATLVLNNLGEKDSPFTVIEGETFYHNYFHLQLAQQISLANN